MPHQTGLEIARRGHQEGWKTRFILLSYLKEPEIILRAKASNIQGYIIKDDAMQELDRCIKCVMRGETYFSQKLLDINTKATSAMMELIESLTPSEYKILNLIAKGQTTKEISQLLHISDRTVEKHRSHIIAKLELDGNPQTLRKWVAENGQLLS